MASASGAGRGGSGPAGGSKQEPPQLRLRPLACAPGSQETEALLRAVRIALGERAPTVPVPAPPWRFSGRSWPLRSSGPPPGGLSPAGVRLNDRFAP